MAEEYFMDEDEFATYLDERYGDIDVCGYKYFAGHALRELDPTAFDCMQADTERWICFECGNLFDDEDDADNCCVGAEDHGY